MQIKAGMQVVCLQCWLWWATPNNHVQEWYIQQTLACYSYTYQRGSIYCSIFLGTTWRRSAKGTCSGVVTAVLRKPIAGNRIRLFRYWSTCICTKHKYISDARSRYNSLLRRMNPLASCNLIHSRSFFSFILLQSIDIPWFQLFFFCRPSPTHVQRIQAHRGW